MKIQQAAISTVGVQQWKQSPHDVEELRNLNSYYCIMNAQQSTVRRTDSLHSVQLKTVRPCLGTKFKNGVCHSSWISSILIKQWGHTLLSAKMLLFCVKTVVIDLQTNPPGKDSHLDTCVFVTLFCTLSLVGGMETLKDGYLVIKAFNGMFERLLFILSDTCPRYPYI